jgi:uncharacterized protein with HEPN domain
MRNRITNAYLDGNLEIVWQTVINSLPDLLADLPESNVER